MDNKVARGSSFLKKVIFNLNDSASSSHELYFRTFAISDTEKYFIPSFFAKRNFVRRKSPKPGFFFFWKVTVTFGEFYGVSRKLESFIKNFSGEICDNLVRMGKSRSVPKYWISSCIASWNLYPTKLVMDKQITNPFFEFEYKRFGAMSSYFEFKGPFWLVLKVPFPNYYSSFRPSRKIQLVQLFLIFYS